MRWRNAIRKVFVAQGKLTTRQETFLRFLRDHAGEVVPVDVVRAASGLAPASWQVYMSARRYGPFLDRVAGGLLVTPDRITDAEFYEQVRQPKSAPSTPKSWQKLYTLASRTLGAGGFAEVFPATRRSDNAAVALKRTKPGPDRRERMRREIDVLSQLNHRNVMAVLDADTSSHEWYCMPQAVRTLEGLAQLELKDAVLDVLNGFAYIHSPELGYAHRDITPRNILLLDDTDGRRWVIADWGLVRRKAGHTTEIRTAGSMGTEAYAAPELWGDAHDADYRADYYGLGRVVAELCGCKLRPNIQVVPKDSEWAEFVQHMTQLDRDARPDNIDAVRALVPGVRSAPMRLAMQPRLVAPELEDLVEACLERHAPTLVDSDQAITSRIAETNASMFAVDSIVVLSAGPMEIDPPSIPFHARIHFTGEQDAERMPFGDSITAELTGSLSYDGEWGIAELDVASAEIDEPSDDYDVPYDEEHDRDR